MIGGASLSGGVGGIGGTAVGVLIIGFLRNGLNLLQVSPFVQQVMIGVVIAVAVAADTMRNRKRDSEAAAGIRDAGFPSSPTRVGGAPTRSGSRSKRDQLAETDGEIRRAGMKQGGTDMGIRKLSLLAAVAAIALLPALGADAKDAKKIGLAVANLQANFFNQIKESVEADGAQKGIKVITVDAKGDAATQVSQIQDLLAQNIDALIYIPGRRDCGVGAGQGRQGRGSSGRQHRP